ncbi:hypothetical protein LPB19_03605 [Marinobacter salinisoli]|uniref:Uncharacterized protein n=1 Tax=Marinobacter salinisoli TaxID=2769486 RepID=A0ABX7MWN7_9GAMM|nr:hypothetical protein [Marinobacter salinisoli]QSP95516.1 hypothetical protein LPB19_03605 [Marinobacter salinisoli]
MRKLEMNKLKLLDQYLGDKIGEGIRLGFVAWAFGILGWCIARLIDRSAWIDISILNNPERLDWYAKILFLAFPVAWAILGCFALRKAKPWHVSALFSFSLALFVWGG